MATLPNPKFRDGAARLLAGTLKTYAPADAAKQIPLQWGDFFALDVPEIHVAEVTYGVVVRADAEAMDYMVAVEVPSFDGVNAPHRETLPAAHYAVFTIDGLAHIQQMWADIYSKWMPQSGFKPAASLAFERYDQRYDPETSSGPFEIWIPIEPAA
jgi:AraC family transcriptional regulator